MNHKNQTYQLTRIPRQKNKNQNAEQLDKKIK